jgi:uncharacterized repeat protein (TIGR01451 family)
MKVLSACFTLLFFLTTALKGQSDLDDLIVVDKSITSSVSIQNTIQVDPIGWSAEHFISNNDTLTYRINFQNVGSDTAFDVHIIDILDPTLFEAASIVIVSASHSFNFWIESFNTLHWDFLQINLPDTSKNEKDSDGYIEFKIKLKPGLPIGTIIYNSAQIHFDSDPPIRTNEVFNTICETGYPAVMISTESDFCKGNIAQFIAHGTVEGPAPVYSWYVNNSFYSNGDTAIIIGLDNGDVVECKLESSYLCALPSTAWSNRIVSTFLDQPVITESGGILTCGPAESYQWFFNQQPMVGETGPSIMPTLNGNYQVYIYDSNGCFSRSVIYVYMNIGVDEISSSISFYPNPVQDHIIFKGLKNNSTLSINDVSGKTVKSVEIHNDSEENTRVNLKDLMPGIYFVGSNLLKTFNAKIVVIH